MFTQKFHKSLRWKLALGYSPILVGACCLGMLLGPLPVFAQEPQQEPPTTQTPDNGKPKQDVPAEAGGPGESASPYSIPKKREDGVPAPPPPVTPKKVEGLPDYSLKVNVPLVNVDVLVTSKSGQFIPGLRKENFRVLEDGVPQAVSNFNVSQAPITAVLLTEFASTHYVFLIQALQASYAFVNTLKKDDWVAVAYYDMQPHILVDFTQDKKAVYGALNQLRIPGFAETNLFDALYDTLDRLDRVEGKKYIVLVTTGVDTFSKLTLDKIMKKIKDAKDVTIFPVSVGFILREYYESHGGAAPHGMGIPVGQMDYLQADNDNYHDPEREEGDAEQPERDAEAELETRPGLNELVDRYSAPAVQYETQQVGLITGPRLSDCGYCMAPTSSFIREMKIPVSGDVECIGFHKDRLLEYEHAARMSLAGLGIRRTRKQINAYVDKIAKPELLNISDVAKDRKWTIYQIGDLRFAPYRTKHHYRGQVTHYRDNGRWFRAKEDEYGTPYGPKSKGSDDAAWVPRHPRTSESSVVMLSPAALAKQWANEDKPLPCPLPTDEALEDSRRKLEANGKPANDNQHHDGLPYDMESADELQFGYAFGTKYPETSDPEPFDDVVERKSLLAALNARLSPQARRVAPMVVLTDETEMLAQTYEEVGVALHAGRRNASVSTLKRHGKLALANAAAEINMIRQELAA